MANEIQNEFFGAIRAIVDANSIATFDQTIIGKIIKVYDDKPGVYRIQSDNITFDAKSQYSDYKYAENDNVYITVMQGDYNNDKVIVGKVESKDLEKSTYTSPFAQIITTGLKKSDQLLSKALTINSTTTLDECSISYSPSYSLQMLDYLGVEVQFESRIEKTVGSYGLTFICKGQGPLFDENGNQEKDEEGQPIIGDVELPIAMSCLQLYGNPYYSNGTLTKKAVISLAGLAGRIIGPITISKVILESKDIKWSDGDIITCKSLVLQPAQDFARYPKESLEIVINKNNSNEIILNKWVHIVDDEPVFITSNDLSLVTQADTISYYVKKGNSGDFELIATKSLNDKSGWSCLVDNPPSLGEYKAVLNISPFTESNSLSFGELEVPEVKVGPPNTLRIEPIGKIRAYCIDTDVEKPSYKVIYYNSDGQSEELTDVEWTWAGGGTVDGDTYAITSYPFDAGNAILSAAARDLTVSIPIPKVTKEYIESEIKGTNYISYSSEGTNPTFEAIPYSIDGVLAWGEPSTTELEGFYGKFAIDKDSCQLQVPTRINSTNPTLYIKLVGEKILYPVIIERKAFENERINRWSGDLTIDSEGNYILSNLIGAGIKEDKENNKTLYTGVLMGLLEDSTTPKNFSRTGIYGFKKSQRVFQLDDSGYFYVGNQNGHLSFDGNGLLLETKKLIMNAGNFLIDSIATGSDPMLRMKDRNQNIIFDFKANGEATIGGCGFDGNGNLQIKNANIAEKLTADSIDVTGVLNAGTISANKITAGTISGDSNKEIKIGGWAVRSTSLLWGASDPDKRTSFINPVGMSGAYDIEGHGKISNLALRLNTKFGVTADGVLYAAGANISGTITASQITNGETFMVTKEGVLTAKSGYIGPINIDENGLGVDSGNGQGDDVLSVYIKSGIIKTPEIRANKFIADTYAAQTVSDSNNYNGGALWFKTTQIDSVAGEFYTISIGSGGIRLWKKPLGDPYSRYKVIKWSTLFDKYGEE